MPSPLAYWVILLFFASTSFAQNQTTIIGGSELSPNRIPQLQILLLGGGGFCSGSLIGPKVVLTAAHCCSAKGTPVKFKNPNGEGTTSGRGTSHPDAMTENNCSSLNLPGDLADRNDLCLVLLDEPVKGITPLSLSKNIPIVGERVLTAGVGDPNPEVRQYGEMVVEKVSNIGATLENHKQKIATDSGDSGGPAFRVMASKELMLLGVTSTGTGDNPGGCLIYNIPAYRTGITLTSSDSAFKFFESYAKKNNVEICGVNSTCKAVFW